MEETLNLGKKKEKGKFKEKRKAFFNSLFSSPLKMILYTSLLLLSIMTLYFLCIYIFCDNFYNAWSDDSLQYYPIMNDFISSIKHGSFSLYSFRNYLGASFFSDVYYVPLDGFTLLIFVLSFFMKTEIAMSIVEIFKMILGSAALMTYLMLKGSKPKNIGLIGILYFASSGITCFACFPSFTSLAFYLPFSLIIGYLFLKKKWWWIVPLYALVVVFYNFYLAYTVFAFMSFMMLFMLILEKEKIKNIILKELLFVLLILFGLLMGMIIFYPSMKYILEATTRDIAEESGIKSLIILGISYIDYFLVLIRCILKFILNSLIHLKGFLNEPTFFKDQFIDLTSLRIFLSKTWHKGDLTIQASFFNIETFYRMINNSFVPSTPSSLYGYQSSYLIDHFSLYITGLGMVLSLYVWTLKDYKSRVYKVLVLFLCFLMFFPFFSFIFSANLSSLYTRWFNIVGLPLLLIDAHVLDEVGLFNLKTKRLFFIVIILFYLAFISSFHHLDKIMGFADKYGWDESLVKLEKNSLYVSVVALFVIGVFLSFLGKGLESKNKKMIIISSILSGIIILALGVVVIVNAVHVPNEALNTEFTDSELFGLDDCLANMYLTALTLLFLLLIVFAIKNNIKILMYIVIGLEFLFSGCMAFGSSVVMTGSKNTFKNSHSLDKFLRECVDTSELYRIYVDSSIDDICDYNIARMLPAPTNQHIFHSFINKSTDEIGGYLFDKEDEGQANKEALNKYSYYLGVLLGYKYIVADINSGYSEFDEEMYTLYAYNDYYILLEVNDFEPFLTYTSFISDADYNRDKYKIKDVSREKYLTENSIIDSEYTELIDSYLEYKNGIEYYESITQSSTFNQKVKISDENGNTVKIDKDYYYEYKFIGDDSITTRCYAINLFNIDNAEEKIRKNEIFYVFEGEDEHHYLTIEDNIRNMNGSSIHIPIYDEGKIEAIYIKVESKTPVFESSGAKELKYTMEAIFPSLNMVNDYEHHVCDNDGDITAYMKFNIKGSYLEKIVSITLKGTDDISFTKMVVEYEDGTFRPSSSEINPYSNIKAIYIEKDGASDVYDLSTPPSVTLLSYTKNLNINTSMSNKKIAKKGSKLTVSYDINEVNDGYSLIVIPYGYSDEWKVAKGDYTEILSANGGLIGLVVKNDTAHNEIVLKFKPNGFKSGAIISALSIVAYIGLVSIMLIIKKKKKGEKAL